jgi:hypothetical protein
LHQKRAAAADVTDEMTEAWAEKAGEEGGGAGEVGRPWGQEAL